MLIAQLMTQMVLL